MTHIIAVTACPSGVAHTYMAAESLESAAKAVVAGRLDHGRAMRSTAMTRKASSTDPCGSLPKGVSA